MHKAWIVALLVGLAGCSGGSDTKVEAPAATDDGGNATVEPVNVTDTPPTVSLRVDADNVTIGSTVNFTIEVEDADGDPIAWLLDTDGDGTPEFDGNASRRVNVTYAAAGVYNATLDVTAGNASLRETVTVVVNDLPEPAIDPDATPYPVTYRQDVLLSCPHCFSSDGTGDVGCVGLMLNDNGLDCAWFPLPADSIGHDFSISGTFFPIWQATPTCDGEDIIDLGIGATGTVPEGAGCIFVWDPIDPVVTMVLTIT